MKTQLIFTFLTLFLYSTIQGQDTLYLYYDSEWNEVENIGTATYISKEYHHRSLRYNVETRYKNGGLKHFKQYDSSEKKSLDGKYLIYFENGQIKDSSYYDNKIHGKSFLYFEDGSLHKELNYVHGNLEGTLKTYWPNGQMRRWDEYKNDELVKGTTWNDKGEEVPYTPYYIQAEYPGGLIALYKYLGENLRYPMEAKEGGFQGRVYIKFIINKDGSISDIEVVRGVHSSIDQEALRVVSEMPNWTPARSEGDIITTTFRLPVVFRLSSPSKKKKKKKKK